MDITWALLRDIRTQMFTDSCELLMLKLTWDIAFYNLCEDLNQKQIP